MIYSCLLSQVQDQVRKFSKILPQNKKLKEKKRKWLWADGMVWWVKALAASSDPDSKFNVLPP